MSSRPKAVGAAIRRAGKAGEKVVDGPRAAAEPSPVSDRPEPEKAAHGPATASQPPTAHKKPAKGKR